METAAKDRRKYLRIPMRQVLSITRSNSTPYSGTLQDLSVAGIRFEVLSCEIELSDVLHVCFQHEDQEVRLLGRVVWCTEVDPVIHEVGIEFLEVPLDCVNCISAMVEAQKMTD